ncbi:vWA domain-containing protein [Actinokineospora pegani]|uniref:vWA domain-containing protein n=1 Tax=Actinokineospora pegani TaxID=2654637 RepID=UPI001F347E71|nr:VWA domain-containing protein [Actinokineospora pegani]
MRTRLKATAMLLVALALAACTTGGAPERDAGTPGTLRVLAGSELADMRPVLERAAAATGVRVELTFVGSLDGAKQVADGTADREYDAVWFSSTNYLRTFPGAAAHLGTSVQTMASPVVLGLKKSTADRLGWAGGEVAWTDVVAAAERDAFTFAMTDPNASNSGFAALLAMTAALDGGQRALDVDAIARVAPQVSALFGGHRLTAPSSGWLTDAYVDRATGGNPGEPVDGLVNYESSLVELNNSGRLPEPMTLIYPADGVVVGDYPLTVLAGATTEAQDLHRRLVEHLRGPEAQEDIGVTTHRRPAVPGVARPAGLPGALNEIPFPDSWATIEALLDAYNNDLRRPSRTVYVLDVSGSMADDGRLPALKQALGQLTGAGSELDGKVCGFREREEVLMVPFSSAPLPTRAFTVDSGDPGPGLESIRAAVDGLAAGGGTAIYDSLIKAQRDLAADRDRFVSIVLMTDGENTDGSGLRGYLDFLASTKPVQVFPILFGEANEAEMRTVAQRTGGQYVDARKDSLASAFCEIRGYQ